MTEKTITVELDEKAARSLLRAEWRNDNDLGTDGWGAASDRAHDAIRAALQAGLKAEVERLREFGAKGKTFVGQKSVSTDTADRLEQLLEESK